MDKIRAMAMAQELQGRTVEGWVVGDYLGNGFSAVVMSATKGETSAALKVIDPEMIERYGTDRQLARIVRENRLEGHTHPNLVSILDGGQCQETGHLYVAMELLEPLTLGDVRDILPATQIGSVICQLAHAAVFLEQLGLVHRDIKPDNTNVSSDYTTIKLLDLGVVYPPREARNPSAGTGNHFVGTARYSPPEFLHRQETDSPEGWRAITFYQLGATLFDLITRTPIFDEYREPPARLYEAIKDRVPTIEPATVDVEPWLVDLARRCLTKDWRIREQLVAWEHFEGPTDVPDSAHDIRERIRMRTSAETNIHQARTHASSSNPSRRMLIDIFRSMSTMIREVCHEGRVFPPLELKATYAADNCTIRMRTGPYVPQDLLGILEIEFLFFPLDPECHDIRVSACAYLVSVANEGDSRSADAFEDIFVGSVSGMEFRELMDVFVHASLESALGAGKPLSEELRLRPNWR